MTHTLHIKRIYEPPKRGDGARVLVDRVWPRGVSKDEAELDLWLKEIAPSTELRKWFGHDPERFAEFRKRYRDELKDKDEAIAELAKLRPKNVTLLYSAHDEQHNQAVVLAEYLGRHGFRLHKPAA
ncbi:MAG TPA: DUF488 domain-containing protein [Sphingomonadaceae bacterium]